MEGELISATLADLESQLADAFTSLKASADDAGRVLRQIKDSREWQHEWATFENYCETRWGFSLKVANKLIDDASGFEMLKQVIEKPEGRSITQTTKPKKPAEKPTPSGQTREKKADKIRDSYEKLGRGGRYLYDEGKLTEDELYALAKRDDHAQVATDIRKGRMAAVDLLPRKREPKPSAEPPPLKTPREENHGHSHIAYEHARKAMQAMMEAHRVHSQADQPEAMKEITDFMKRMERWKRWKG